MRAHPSRFLLAATQYAVAELVEVPAASSASPDRAARDITVTAGPATLTLKAL